MKSMSRLRNSSALIILSIASLAMPAPAAEEPSATPPASSTLSMSPTRDQAKAPPVPESTPTVSPDSVARPRLTAIPLPLPPPVLDINDVSFLWPVPQTKADVDALISLNDAGADGKIFPDILLGKLIDEAKTVGVGNDKINFPNEAEFKNPATWKVVGIRVNPSALGSNVAALTRGGIIPSIRLIVQPVTVSGNNFQIHDVTAHVVFLQTLPRPDKTKPFQPDNAAFGAVVRDIRDIKAFLEKAGVRTKGRELDVHPGFRLAANRKDRNPVPGFTDKLRGLLKTHLSSKRLGVISFMGIEGGFEPWIFFKVTVENGNLVREPISGNFSSSTNQAPILSQMISFRSGAKVDPAPVKDVNAMTQGFGISTSLLFPVNINSHLDDILFPGAPSEPAKSFKVRHVADFIANPFFRNTGNTDCVSCHTETTRRNTLGLTATPGIAFKQPAGISKVATVVLPKDKWNLRDFGWGLNFFENRTFKATITQRAANEAAESADLINNGSLTLPVSQPVAQVDTATAAITR
jgi:hypothetical protein